MGAEQEEEDLPWAEPQGRSFAPMESPYEGLLQALQRIRKDLGLVDKYLGAIERDAKAALAELQSAPRQPQTPRVAPEPLKRPRAQVDGKSWRR